MSKTSRMLQSLGEVISIHRQRKELTQTDLAQEVGISQVYICKLEMGRIGRPGLGILEAIAGELGMPLWKLFFDATLRMQGKNVHDTDAIQVEFDLAL